MVFTAENLYPYFVGLWQTPSGAVFLGTVHHPSDYFYYVSQFAQGATRWITTLDLYTAESIGPTFVGWSNVFLGHILALFGTNPFQSYHISIALLCIALFFAAFHLSKEVLGSNRLAVISLFLFGIYHAFPILRDGLPSYGDYFNNFAVPRVRFGAVPHQLLLAVASISLSFIMLRWHRQKNRSIRLLMGIVISSIILASLQPALWIVIIGIFGVTSTMYALSKKDKSEILNTFIFPIFIAGLAGILPILYLSNLFDSLPFIQLRTWEASQQTRFTIGHFISATGPIFIGAIASIPWFLVQRSYTQVYVVLFTMISYVLFLSPIPAMLNLSHVRFMSTLAILYLCIITTVGIEKLSEILAYYLHKAFPQTRRFQARHVTLFTVILLTIYLIPNHLLTIKLASEFSPTNAYHYLARNEYEFLLKTSNTSDPADIFLVIWPYNSVFPAITGRKSFHGHSLLTINTIQKDAQAIQFFDNKMNDEQARAFLRDNRITQVIAYSWTTLPKGLMIHTATGGSLSLFAVNQEHLKPYSK